MLSNRDLIQKLKEEYELHEQLLSFEPSFIAIKFAQTLLELKTLKAENEKLRKELDKWAGWRRSEYNGPG
jgi:hypothetical protein